MKFHFRFSISFRFHFDITYHTNHSFGLYAYPFCTGRFAVVMESHQGHADGASFCIVPWKLTGRFCKKAATPSLLSLLENNSYTIRLSSKCVLSGVPGFRYMSSFIMYVEMPLQFLTISSAISSARGSTASGLERVSEKRLLRSG